MSALILFAFGFWIKVESRICHVACEMRGFLHSQDNRKGYEYLNLHSRGHILDMHCDNYLILVTIVAVPYIYKIQQ
jgi:hypothetical protein